PVETGHDIKEIFVEDQDYKLTGNGFWDKTKKMTELSLKLSSQNVGQAVKRMGYKAGIAHGKGDLDINVTWPGHPFAFNVNALLGQIEVNLKEGEIVGINPGIAKLLSLLSIDSLQRRLQL